MKIDEINIEGSYYSPWKAYHHSDEINLIKKGGIPVPKDIQVDLEGFCPHSCEFCTYRNVNWQNYGMKFNEPSKRINEKTGLPKAVALRLPKELHEAGVPSIELTGGGEPLVYPYIIEFLDELAKYPIELSIVTQGASMGKKIQERINNLKWVRFSVDAITPETHSKVHRVPPSVFNVVIKNIKDMVNRQIEDCKIGISMVVTQNNLMEMQKAAPFFKDMGVDNIRYTFVYDPQGDGALSPDQVEEAERSLDIVRSYEDKDFKVFGTMRRLEHYSQPNSDFHFCGYQFFTLAIGCDGEVYPCCIMKYHEGSSLGNLKESSLSDIILSEKRKKYIESFDVSKCKPCWMRETNQFIEYLLAKDPMHVNFV